MDFLSVMAEFAGWPVTTKHPDDQMRKSPMITWRFYSIDN